VGALAGLRGEIGQYVRAFETLNGTDMLIIPGTGLLTDAWGLSSWGPYSLFKWSVMAKLRRCRIVFVSVGAGPIYTRLGRFLVRSSLGLADYRSFRDRSSLEYVRSIGFRRRQDCVYPDLAFSLPEGTLPMDDRGATPRRVVGLGLMVYPGRYSSAAPRGETYEAYLEALASFVDRLLSLDYDVRLLLGDEDTQVIQDFRSALEARVGVYDEARVIDRPIRTVEEVLLQLAATDVVVATRFHNVLLALLLNKPVIAISFHHKCSSLMSEMGLAEYSQDIEELTSARLIEQFEDLERNGDDVKRRVALRVADCRTALDQQYDAVLRIDER
jgi:polysaccharide pyruvyl transferase WcaK-like protein